MPIMKGELIAKVTKEIDAPAERIWKALTTPRLIKKYMFGTDAESDFKPGSPITYSGVHEGREYHDKGTVIEVVPNKILHTTHYSPTSGKEDRPENYHHLVYELDRIGNKTLVRLSQDNIGDEEELKQMEKNWDQMLDGLKRVVEPK
jgi:uncharacterized protein YndB with AHSA1/START domain